MERLKYSGMDKKQKRRTITAVIVGGGIIASILLLTTIWVSNSARTGTSEAVNRVSEFYLEELAGRRAQVVSEELKNKIKNINLSLIHI